MATKQITKHDPDLYHQYNPGDKLILVSWFNEAHPGSSGYSFHDENFMPATNSSGEIRVEGWLGCTDNINKTSLGWYQIEEIEQLLGYRDDFARKYNQKSPISTKFVLTKIDDANT
jgi:hypothetical protein